jgi:hypothetical protein
MYNCTHNSLRLHVNILIIVHMLVLSIKLFINLLKPNGFLTYHQV